MKNWMRSLPLVVCGIMAAGAVAATAWWPAGGSGMQQLQSEQWPQPAPQLAGTPQDWLNTNGRPLDLRTLTNTHHVVLIDFWEYTCVNCLRTLPYLEEWNRRYAKDGLVIIGVHTPEFQFAHSRANVAAAVKRLGITYPVLVDSQYLNWNLFRNSYWPRHYLVDWRDLIVADHSGEGGYRETELEIQRLLHQIHPALHFPQPMSPVHSADKAGAVCYPMTPELYVGSRGAEDGQHGNLDPWQPGHTEQFVDPGVPHDDGEVYANGLWTQELESLQHARHTTDLSDYVALKYHALQCNAVIKPETGKPFVLYVAQDNMPVPKADAGADLKYDTTGNSYLLVDQPRMYYVIKNHKFGYHELRLATRSRGFGLYSFTFTSCEEP